MGIRSTDFNLISECQKLLLIELLDKIWPEKVEWNMIEKNPRNKYHQISNIRILLQIIKRLRIKVIQINCLDIVNGDQSTIYSLLYSLMKVYYVRSIRINLQKNQSIQRDLENNTNTIEEGGSNLESFKTNKNGNPLISESQIVQEFNQRQGSLDEEVKLWMESIGRNQSQKTNKNQTDDKESFYRNYQVHMIERDEELSAEEREEFYRELLKPALGDNLSLSNAISSHKSFSDMTTLFKIKFKLKDSENAVSTNSKISWISQSEKLNKKNKFESIDQKENLFERTKEKMTNQDFNYTQSTTQSHFDQNPLSTMNDQSKRFSVQLDPTAHISSDFDINIDPKFSSQVFRKKDFYEQNLPELLDVNNPEVTYTKNIKNINKSENPKDKPENLKNCINLTSKKEICGLLAQLNKTSERLDFDCRPLAPIKPILIEDLAAKAAEAQIQNFNAHKVYPDKQIILPKVDISRVKIQTENFDNQIIQNRVALGNEKIINHIKKFETEYTLKLSVFNNIKECPPCHQISPISKSLITPEFSNTQRFQPEDEEESFIIKITPKPQQISQETIQNNHLETSRTKISKKDLSTSESQMSTLLTPSSLSRSEGSQFPKIFQSQSELSFLKRNSQVPDPYQSKIEWKANQIVKDHILDFIYPNNYFSPKEMLLTSMIKDSKILKDFETSKNKTLQQKVKNKPNPPNLKKIINFAIGKDKVQKKKKNYKVKDAKKLESLRGLYKEILVKKLDSKRKKWGEEYTPFHVLKKYRQSKSDFSSFRQFLDFYINKNPEK